LYFGSLVSFGSCGFVVPCGFSGFLCGLAELSLCILHVYLGALYVFLMKFSYLSKKILKGNISLWDISFEKILMPNVKN
jgi:hypothetical protein